MEFDPTSAPERDWEIDREAIALHCRRYEGTRHRQRRREAGRGVDCIQFVLGALEAAGATPPVRLPSYSQRVGFSRTENSIAAAFAEHFHCRRIALQDWEPQDGDIGIFRAGRFSNHVGIVSGGRFWHVTTEAPVHHCAMATITPALQEAVRFTAPGFRIDPATIQLTR